MKRITRTGWAIAGLNNYRHESIAEHSFGTSLLTLLISRNLIGEDIKVDSERALIMAMVHDLPESEISDIPHTATQAGGISMSDGKKKAEWNAVRNILANEEDLQELWREYESQETIESRIVRGADIIDMLIHALSLEDSGASPKIFDPFFRNSKQPIDELDLQVISRIYSQLAEEHQARLDRT